MERCIQYIIDITTLIIAKNRWPNHKHTQPHWLKTTHKNMWEKMIIVTMETSNIDMLYDCTTNLQ